MFGHMSGFLAFVAILICVKFILASTEFGEMTHFLTLVTSLIVEILHLVLFLSLTVSFLLFFRTVLGEMSGLFALETSHWDCLGTVLFLMPIFPTTITSLLGHRTVFDHVAELLTLVAHREGHLVFLA